MRPRTAQPADPDKRRLEAAEKAARDYIARGFSVVAVAKGEKRPLVRWQTFQTRQPSLDEIRQWFRRWPDANVAIVTGRLSGLVVLDIDPQRQGSDTLAYLEQKHGPLPPTVESITGGRGRHVYFAHPGGEVPNMVAFVPGIDVRGDGGIVVAPPSLHPTGRRYAWRQGHAPGEIALADMPAWLISLERGLPAHPGHSVAYWRALLRRGVEAGERNTTIASFAGHLFWHGVDRDVVCELLLCWNRIRCRPPLSDDEVAQTVASVHRTHLRHSRDSDKGRAP
jgi:hypothetical protein